MAESKHTMARLERLEGAFVQITDVLALQGERLDGLRDDMHDLRNEMHGVREETRVMREALTERLEGVTDRLDRLIAITTKERTVGIERLANIELRLAKLEERVGS